jgi:hypothetical protein
MPDENTTDTVEGEGQDVSVVQEDQDTETEFDQERAMATIRKQRESEKALAQQLKETKATLAKLEAAEKKRQAAELSEVERLQAENQDLAGQLQALEAERETLILRSAVEREASRLGFHNPADAYGLADLSGVQVDDGEVSGVDKALKALAKERPYLIKAVEKPNIDSSAKGDGKREPDKEGIARRFGL